MHKFIFFIFASITALPLPAGQLPPDNSHQEKEWIEENIRFATAQIRQLLQVTNPENKQYPRTTGKDGALVSTTMHDWTSGFFPGNLWYLYELSHDDTFKATAEKWTITLEPLKAYKATHDLGFMMYCSFGNGRRLAPEETAGYKTILIQGANALSSRFNETTRCIQSWQQGTSWHGTKWEFPVIIDNMMNLELLMWAAKTTGDTAEATKFRHIALTHANTTIQNHLRPDYSTYHVVDYHPQTGEVNEKVTAQGWSDNSTWARAQAWGIYGFTVMYRETGDKNYLTVAQKMADFFLHHPRLPADKIPFWDFNAKQPGYMPAWPERSDKFPVPPAQFPIANYRDASAGAVVTSALFELYTHTQHEPYLTAAIAMLHSLSSDAYRAKAGENAGFLLRHSVGSIPHGVEIDVPLVYADYYFLEALVRYRNYLNAVHP